MTAPVTLPTAQLGTTDMQITRVGMGAWAIGGGWKFGWGNSDDAESVRSIQAAVDAGINWVDTAPVYGLGKSETVVGAALSQIPEADRPLIFTKCGLIFQEGEPDQAPQNVLAPASIRKELDASLQRLGIERIDLYQVHWPPTDGTPLEEYWGTMAELRSEGKVRAIGLSNHDIDQLNRAEAVAHIDSLQPPFSLIHRDTAGDLLAWCREHDTGVICYSPMQSGLLTGAMSAERVAGLPHDDWRATHPDFTDGLTANLALADALKPVAERHGVPVAAVAVAWALAWPGITGAIVGARKVDQLDGWLPAADLTLTPEDLDELAEAVRRTGAGEGPERPE